MSDNTQHKLKRVRPPRVKITYDVETEGAEKSIELPLVCGIISDLSAHNTSKSSIREKDFVEVDRDNIDHYMRSVNPQLSYTVKNIISSKTPKISVNLSFQSLDDFEVKQVINQIPETKEIYDRIQMLKEMLVKLDGNYILSDMITDLIKNKQHFNSFKSQLSSQIDKDRSSNKNQSEENKNNTDE